MQRKNSLFWPLVLIAAGVLWILIQLGRIPASNLWALSYLWPFILIGVGIGLILRPYWSWAGQAMSILVVGGLFAGVIFAPQLGWNHIPQDLSIGGVLPGVSGERGSGHVVTQTRSVSDFDTIHIAFPATYTIHQGSAEALTITAEDNVAETIDTRVKAGELEIDNGPDHKAYITPTKPVKVDITVKDLKELRFESAGEVTVEGLHASDLKAQLDGAGGLNLNDVELKSLEATLSGVGSVRGTGSATKLDVRVDGLGSFDGAALHSDSAVVTLDGVGGAKVWADSQVIATVNGLGSVDYYGNAHVTKSVNGLGSVRYMGTK